MSVRTSMLLLLFLALAIAGADRLWGPLGTRITDRRDEGQRLRVVAVAPLFADSAALLDFLDNVKSAYDNKQILEVDVVLGRKGADLRTMDLTPPAQWQRRVLVSYRRAGDTMRVVLAARVRGAPSRGG